MPLLPLLRSRGRVVFSPIDAYSDRFLRESVRLEGSLARLVARTKWALLREVERRCIPACTACHVVSASDREYLSAFVRGTPIKAVPIITSA